MNTPTSTKRNHAARTIQKAWRSAWLRNSTKPILDPNQKTTWNNIFEFEPIPRKYMVALNKKPYDARQLAKMILKGVTKIPHSRRNLNNSDYGRIISRLNDSTPTTTPTANKNRIDMIRNIAGVSTRHLRAVTEIRNRMHHIRTFTNGVFSSSLTPMRYIQDGVYKRTSGTRYQLGSAASADSRGYKYVRFNPLYTEEVWNASNVANVNVLGGVTIDGCLLKKPGFLLYNPTMFDIQSASLGIRIHTILPSKPGFPGFRVKLLNSSSNNVNAKNIAVLLAAVREAYANPGSVFAQPRLPFIAASNVPRAIKDVIDIVNSVGASV